MDINQFKDTLETFEQARLAYHKKHRFRYWKDLPLTIAAIFTFFMIIFLIGRFPEEPLKELAGDALFVSLGFSWLINFFVRGVRMALDEIKFLKVFKQMVLNSIFAAGKFKLAIPQKDKINQEQLQHVIPGSVAERKWKPATSLAMQGNSDNKPILVSIFTAGETMAEQTETIYVEMPTKTQFNQPIRVFSKKAISAASRFRRHFTRHGDAEVELNYGVPYRIPVSQEDLPFEIFCDLPQELNVKFSDTLIDALKEFFVKNEDLNITIVISEGHLSCCDMKKRYMRKDYEGIFKLDAFLKEKITEQTAERFAMELEDLEITIESLVELEKAL